MERIDAFLRIASGRLNRRQAGAAGVMLLALLTGADPAVARTRTRNAKRKGPRSSLGAYGRRPCGGIAGLPCPDGFVCVDDPRDDCDPATGGADCIGICVRERMCGGIAGIPCPAGFVCIDDPRDDCDPAAGGADCPGICVRKVKDPCATIRCRPGTRCCPNCGGICIPDEIPCSNELCVSEPCNQAVCGPGEYCCNESCSRCVGLGQGCTREFCPPELPPGEPCGRNRCGAGEYCCNPSCGVCAPLGARCAAVVCDPEPGGLCGGFANIPCPDGFVCVDDPNDRCDPATGGADCSGICVPIDVNPCAAILCIEGTTCCPQCGGICIASDVPCSENLCVGEPCNQVMCGPGEFCCNESCSICAPLGGVCTDQFCDPEPGGLCGGFANIPCPDGFVCVDVPGDDCDPSAGGFDCPGFCVPIGENPCAAIRCRPGTRCCPNCGGICIPDGIPCSEDRCVSEPCNQVMCGPGEYCCNESCSICAPFGDGCTDQFCEPPGYGVPCGPTICAPGQVCCNESCGICTPPGGVCILIACID
jgi:hypothetical protein